MTADPGGPRVVHVVLSLDVGGLERIVLDLIRRGRAAGGHADVVCLERRGTLAAEAEAEGARVLCVDKPPGRRPEVVGRLRDAFSRLAPDVVHTHQIAALYYAGPAARRAGVPSVVHTEHINHARKRTDLAGRVKIRMLWGIAGRHASRFFCVSEDIAAAVAAFGAVPGRKLSVVRNGIDTAAFAPSAAARAEARRELASLGVPEGAEVVGTVGRLAEVKRQDVLIRGFALVAAARPRSHLVLVGDGPERAALEGLAESSGLAGRVHFAGYRDRPERLARGMDVFALTSRLEGLPLAILEAWAAGLPVVATPVGGVADLIAHGETGLLVPVGDPGATADAIALLFGDPGLSARIGSASRARAVAEFDASTMAMACDRHYRELLAPPARKRAVR